MNNEQVDKRGNILSEEQVSADQSVGSNGFKSLTTGAPCADQAASDFVGALRLGWASEIRTVCELKIFVNGWTKL